MKIFSFFIMKTIILAFILVIVAVNSATITSDFLYKPVVKEEWELFKMMYNKTYSVGEEQQRLLIFLNNRQKIAHHNKKYEKGLVTFTMAINQFGDMTLYEFSKKMNGFNKSLLDDSLENETDFEGATFLEPANIELPNEVDWRTQGAVTPVKDQGECGSCWAFSATGSLEGQHFRHKGTLISLSEQNLIDCSTRFGNNGCEGGLMDNAFKYVKYNHGLDTEKSYPYEGEDDRCRYKPADSGADDAGFVDIPSGSEIKLQAAVATVGPISVAIDADHFSFQFYKSGVYYEKECSSVELDHGVLAVGYGTDQNTGKQYWLVKNSWGTTWGDQGYIKMSRNLHNNCGIASKASYPLVK